MARGRKPWCAMTISDPPSRPALFSGLRFTARISSHTQPAPAAMPSIHIVRSWKLFTMSRLVLPVPNVVVSTSVMPAAERGVSHKLSEQPVDDARLREFMGSEVDRFMGS